MPAPPRLILASTSIYRRQLLERLKLPFEVANPGIAEPHHPGEQPPARSARLAAEKAQAVAMSHPHALVIGSDQVAVCRGQVLDKPGGEAGSWSHLRLLSGSVAEFYTAVALAGHRADLAVVQNYRRRRVEANVAAIDRGPRRQCRVEYADVAAR